MFRRLETSLPKDPDFPADLPQLGYQLVDGVVRSRKDNEQTFRYRITNNGRYNDLNKQALTDCVTEEISKRMAELGGPEYYVPQMTAVRPHSEPNVPIFMTPQQELVSKDRVVIVVPGRGGELGCWSFHKVVEESIEGNGSCVGLLRALGTQKDSPGLIVLNPDQLNYSYEFNKGLSMAGWMHRPRKTLYTPEHIVDPEYNLAQGNETPQRHVEFVFDNIVNSPDFVSPLAKLDVIGIGCGGEDVLELLRRNWNLYNGRVSALALVQTWYHPEKPLEEDFQAFLSERGRMWKLSSAPVNAPIIVPGSEEFERSMAVTPVFSGGVNDYSDHILPTAQNEILEWMAEVAASLEYRNPRFEIWVEEVMDEEAGRIVEVV